MTESLIKKLTEGNRQYCSKHPEISDTSVWSEVEWI
jgi:hypothetical protein